MKIKFLMTAMLLSPLISMGSKALETVSCDSRTDFFEQRYDSCMSAHHDGSYCSKWMGCCGPTIKTLVGTMCTPDADRCDSKNIAKDARALYKSCMKQHNNTKECSYEMACCGPLVPTIIGTNCNKKP